VKGPTVSIMGSSDCMTADGPHGAVILLCSVLCKSLDNAVSQAAAG